MNNRIQSVDGLRFFLFLGIFLFHAWSDYFPLGWGGVECFLLITSFFLTSKLLKQNPADICIIPSIIKRANRLYPPYITIVIALGVWSVIFSHSHKLPDDFFSYFIFAQNYYWLYNPEGSQVFACGHLWYLTLDFYLVLLWLILFKIVRRRYITMMLIALIVLAVVFRAYFSQVNHMMAYTVPFGAIDSFALGGLLAVFMRNDFKSKMLPVSIGILGLIAFAACVIYVAGLNDAILLQGWVKTSSDYAYDPLSIQLLLAIPMICFALVWFCLVPRRHYGIFSNPRIVAIGAMTYELYLIHYPILVVLKLIISNRVIVIIVGLILTYIAALVWNKLYTFLIKKM